jgi:hypothetical protein
MNKVEIIRKDLSPLQLKVAGVLIVLAISYKVLTWTFYDVSPIVYILGILAVFLIWTAKDIIIIDMENKLIREGFKILGLKYLDKTKYSGLEKIYINRVGTSETFRHLTRSIDIQHENYKAFLKTQDGNKYWIGVNSDKDKLINRLKSHNKILMTNIYDNSILADSIRVD